MIFALSGNEGSARVPGKMLDMWTMGSPSVMDLADVLAWLVCVFECLLA